MSIKCEMCGNEVVREYKVYISLGIGSDQEVVTCGRCHILTNINDNLKKLVDKATTSVNIKTPNKITMGASPLPNETCYNA